MIRSGILRALMAAALCVSAPRVDAQNSLFTYQGKLSNNGSPATGLYDFRFVLRDATEGGSQVGPVIETNAVPVDNGCFIVGLDFGASAFSGSARWLEIQVTTNGSAGFIALQPRQQITAAPYATHADEAVKARSAQTVTGTISDDQLSTNVPLLSGDAHFTGSVSAERFFGSGTNLTGLWRLDGNGGTSANDFLGTKDRTPLQFQVNGERVFRFEASILPEQPNVLGGSSANWVEAAIAATIGGGFGHHIASTSGATISGGNSNEVAGASYATIGGGGGNRIGGDAHHSVIAGGGDNIIGAGAIGGVISGGVFNTVTGACAIVAGGIDNSASAHYSFAGGSRARAVHEGAFVWADSQDGNFSSTTSNQFNVRAKGGVRFETGGAGVLVDGQPLTAQVLTNGSVTQESIAANAVTSQHIATGTIEPADLNADLFETNFWSAAGNVETVPGIHFMGTRDFKALELRVNNRPALRIEPARDGMTPNLVGGIGDNYISPDVFGSIIAGGGSTNASYLGTNIILSSVCFIGSGSHNSIGTNSDRSVIVGGNHNAIHNDAFSSTIGGGFVNRILERAVHSTIAGGSYNTIQTNAARAFIGGGLNATVEASYSGIVAGHFNKVASGSGSGFIGAGSNNTIGTNADCAMIPGGFGNMVSGDAAFAAGSRAHAAHDGTFVWADVQSGEFYATNDFASTSSNQFLVRATGGFGVNTNAPQAAMHIAAIDHRAAQLESSSDIGTWLSLANTSSGGDYWSVISSGAGNGEGAGKLLFYNGTTRLMVDGAGNVSATSFNPTSDRAAKENFKPVDAREVLEKVTSLPIARWNYKTDDEREHLGPVAQDFHQAFGLNGTDDRHISTVDADGVALAAIQGLHQLLKEKETQISSLEERLQQLELRINSDNNP